MRSIIVLLVAVLCISDGALGQNVMTPEGLWQLGRVSGLGITPDGRQIIYRVSTPDIAENKSRSVTYSIPLTGGSPVEVSAVEGLLKDKNVSPDGKYRIRDRKSTRLNSSHVKIS